jgi:hypothetical protein
MPNFAQGFMRHCVFTHLIPSIVERGMKDFNCLHLSNLNTKDIFQFVLSFQYLFKNFAAIQWMQNNH